MRERYTGFFFELLPISLPDLQSASEVEQVPAAWPFTVKPQTVTGSYKAAICGWVPQKPIVRVRHAPPGGTPSQGAQDGPAMQLAVQLVDSLLDDNCSALAKAGIFAGDAHGHIQAVARIQVGIVTLRNRIS